MHIVILTQSSSYNESFLLDFRLEVETITDRKVYNFEHLYKQLEIFINTEKYIY